jgi:hypothetical protein
MTVPDLASDTVVVHHGHHNDRTFVTIPPEMTPERATQLLADALAATLARTRELANAEPDLHPN